MSGSNKHHEDEEEYSLDKYSQLVDTLPSSDGWGSMKLVKYGNFWYTPSHLISTMAIRDTFQPHPSDIFLVTYPKCGTTWIKALVFAIVNRTRFAFDNNHPLLAYNPHICVPFLTAMYLEGNVKKKLEELPQPRLLAVHTPYSAMPLSLDKYNYRVIYLCRNPKDTFVSLWHFRNELRKDSVVPFKEAAELFCQGCSLNGPVWEHMLEYWRESLRQPDRILFLKYEELKAEPVKNVRRLADFVGYPFLEKEVEDGVLEDILNLCSFEKLRNAEVNQNDSFVGPDNIIFKHSLFFRKGNVGDWKEHLTSAMAQKFDTIIEEKLRGSGLTFIDRSLNS